MNLIKDFLLSPNGGGSSTRLCVLVVVIGIGVEHVVAAARGTPLAWDWQQTAAIVGALGAKVTQRAFESREETKT